MKLCTNKNSNWELNELVTVHFLLPDEKDINYEPIGKSSFVWFFNSNIFSDKERDKTRGKSKNRLLWAALLARTFNLQKENSNLRIAAPFAGYELNFFDDFQSDLQFVMHFSWDNCYFYEHEHKIEREISNYAGWKVEAKWLLFGLYLGLASVL